MRTEIVAGFAAVIVAFGAVAAYSLARQQRAVASMRLANEGYLRVAEKLNEIRVNQGLLNTLVDQLVEMRDRVGARTWLVVTRRTRRQRVQSAIALVREARRGAVEADDLALTARAERALARVDALYAQDEPRFEALFEALSAQRLAEAREVEGEVLRAEGECEDALRSLTRELQIRTRRLADEAERRQRQSLQLTLSAIAVACVLGALSAVSALRALRPLTRLRDRARAVARGDLSAVHVDARDDEIGELAAEFERMVGAVGARDAALRRANDEIRAAERHLEQVVATLRAAVLVVGGDGRVATANAAARRFAGDGDALEGRGLAETLFGRDEAVLEAARAAREEGRATTLPAARLGERVFDLAAVPFATGEARGALVVADDVTERELARSRLMQAERLAAIGRMAAHVTHEVRNPLSSMALNAEMLGDELAALGPEAREPARLVGAIQREIDRLTGITEEYLRVARLPKPRLEREDLADVVLGAAAFVEREMAAAGVSLRVRADEPVPAVMLDEAQLRQCLLNLFRNAREAMELAGVEAPAITARVRAAGPERGGAVVEVCDAGPGLTDEAIAHLYELFYTTKQRGSGLGLPLTREIVAAHGGSITADRAPAEDGGGARFTIWLPAARGEANDDES